MVDIDTAFQSVPEIWGLSIRVQGFFEGAMKPSPLQFFWQRGSTEGDSGASGIYQSTLSNIHWLVDSNSSVVIKQIQERMHKQGASELSIMFSVDMYQTSGSKNYFATGRILGTIGVSGPWSPQVSVWGRSLSPMFTVNSDNMDKKDTSKYVYTNHAPFVIDQQQKKLHICALNSLLTLKDGSPMQFPERTKLGYFPLTKERGSLLYTAESYEESPVIIADLSSFNLKHIMNKLGGIIDIDLSQEQLEAISHTPLSIFQVIIKLPFIAS